MLAVFSGEVVEVPAELVAAGSRTPSPKTRASELVTRFLGTSGSDPAVSVQLADLGHLAYSHTNQALLRPRYRRSTSSCSAALHTHHYTSVTDIDQDMEMEPWRILLSLSLSLASGKFDQLVWSTQKLVVSFWVGLRFSRS
jgi:hypothetical protein